MQIPFDASNMTVWIIAVVAILAVIDVIWLNILTRKIKRLLGGSSAQTIEEALALIRKELDHTATFKKELSGYLESAEERIKRSVQSIETIRFNPFKGSGDGGNQSFVTAMINENGDGVVVSSLFSRERTSIFSKPIRNFKSEFELTEEELQAIEKTKASLRT